MHFVVHKLQVARHRKVVELVHRDGETSLDGDSSSRLPF